MGGVLRYKWEVYCGVSLSSRLRCQQGTALQMGGVLRYKLGVYCQHFSDKLYGLGAPEQCPTPLPLSRSTVGTPSSLFPVSLFSLTCFIFVYFIFFFFFLSLSIFSHVSLFILSLSISLYLSSLFYLALSLSLSHSLSLSFFFLFLSLSIYSILLRP